MCMEFIAIFCILSFLGISLTAVAAFALFLLKCVIATVGAVCIGIKKMAKSIQRTAQSLTERMGI